MVLKGLNRNLPIDAPGHHAFLPWWGSPTSPLSQLASRTRCHDTPSTAHAQMWAASHDRSLQSQTWH